MARSNFVVTVAPAVPLQCQMNCIQKILVAKRLSKEFDCPRFHCADAHRNVTVAGNEHYRNTNVSRRKLALKIQSAQSTQPNVQDKTTDCVWQRSF